MTTQLFTVDVEESFHASALEPFVPRSHWGAQTCRVERGVDALLDLLERYGATGTFFTLGIVGERTPDVVRRIAQSGHEVASHGWSHRRVSSLTAEQFRCELARSRDLLSDLTGKPVLGFRAPNFSITREHPWAFDVLLEEGYQYDSSVFPARRSGRGFDGRIHTVRRAAGELIELPMTPAHFGSLRIPAGGGAWFRLLPYGLSRRALQQAAERGEPGVFYIHPWELDSDQPKYAVRPLTRIRHYGGLARVAARIGRLLSEFRFVSIQQWLHDRQPSIVLR